MITLNDNEKKEARIWRENKINEIVSKLKKGENPTWMEKSFCEFWKQGWIFSIKW